MSVPPVTLVGKMPPVNQMSAKFLDKSPEKDHEVIDRRTVGRLVDDVVNPPYEELLQSKWR